MGNTINNEDYLNFILIKKRSLVDNLHKPKVDENLDESFLQVFPNKKEDEKTKKYNKLILANETGISIDEQTINKCIINPQKNKQITNQSKDIEKYYNEHKGNPQYTIEYIDSIIDHLKQSELINCSLKDYMKNQREVTPRMRAILIDWLIDVSK